jgi:hypothetical protein
MRHLGFKHQARAFEMLSRCATREPSHRQISQAVRRKCLRCDLCDVPGLLPYVGKQGHEIHASCLYRCVLLTTQNQNFFRITGGQQELEQLDFTCRIYDLWFSS